MHRITRRELLGTSVGIGAALATTRFVSAQDATPAASPVTGEWTFTDDKGVTVTLPEAPKTVVIDVNAAAALWDFGVRPAAVFGWLANPEGNFGAAGGNIDPTQVKIIGDGSGETIDVEALVALQPDLVVTLTFAPDEPTDYWSLVPGTNLEQVQQIAPIVALSGVSSASTGVTLASAIRLRDYQRLEREYGGDALRGAGRSARHRPHL